MKSLFRRVITVSLSGLFLLVLCSATGAVAQERVGYVAEIEGRWILNGRLELSRGQALPPSGLINVQSPTQHDHIVVATLNGGTISRNCGNPGECERPLKLPGNVRPKNSVWEVVLDSAMRLLWGEDDTISIHRSRGGGADLSDGIVALKSGKLELGPIFKAKPAGTYYLRFRAIPLHKGEETKEQIGPMMFGWHRTVRQALTVPAMRPGLYEVTLTDERGNEAPSQDNDAWMLVTNEADYAKSMASFRRAEMLTRKWGNRVNYQSAGSFLRAYLNYLALTGSGVKM